VSTVGVYLHVPFCERVCPYCDFAVVAARPLSPSDEARYVGALRVELERRAGCYAGLALSSLYLGGGTPSLLSPESVAALVGAVRSAFPATGRGEVCEVTLEVNPSTVEQERLPGFRAAGVNRLSVGVQSFDDEVLRRLGRAHRAAVARSTLAAARDAGFRNVSVDLIFGAPGGSASQLERDLAELAAFGPEHVSTYELTVEAGTPFALAAARGQLAPPGDEAVVAALERIESRLAAAGLTRYELSNHARPGFESRHNQRYWRREPVLGLGASAVSSLPRTAAAPHGGRASNLRSLPGYLAAIESAGEAVAEAEEHEPPTARLEAVFLGLRHVAGLAAEPFAEEFGAPPRAFFADQIDGLRAEGLLLEDSLGGLRLSAKGRLLADTVAERFVP